jgi:transposase
MIQISVQTRILVAVQAVDFRKGIDGLARVCQEQLLADPFSGRLFVFRNRRQTALKILAYDWGGPVAGRLPGDRAVPAHERRC